MKILSIAIPCYNSAAYMRRCIDSLLSGGEDVEILIVDDGSTKDNTAEIADRYEKEYPCPYSECFLASFLRSLISYIYWEYHFQ